MERGSSRGLYNKLLFLCTAVLACVVLALMGYFLNSMRNRYLEQNREHLERMHMEARDYLESCADIADYLHEELYKSNMEMNDLLHYLTDSPEEYQRYRLDTYSEYGLLDYNGIEDFTRTAFEAYPVLKRIAFVSYSKGNLTSFGGGQSDYHTGDGSAALERIRSGNLADRGEFSLLKELRHPLNMQSLGAMIVTFDVARLEQIQASYELPELIVYQKSGTVILETGEEIAAETLEEARQEGRLEETLRAYVKSEDVGQCCVVGYLPRKDAARLPVLLVAMIVGVGLAVLGAGAALVNGYLRRVSARLNRILDGMTQVMGGDLSVRLAAQKDGDELDVIAAHFNEMCEKLDLHIQKSYLAEIEQKNAEMAALQSQINPHFLYNTLEAIRMKAICNGDKEVGKMLYSMAVTFRSQLKEADVIPLASELHYCKKYLELFEYRYPGKFRSEVDCPLEYMQTPIIKFVLQPIIENYFIHGIRMRETDNYIRICVEKCGDAFEITVEDNGRGMTQEELQSKNEQLAQNQMDPGKSIGIANVNRRVRAVYGNGCGVRMEHAKPRGLRVILRFRPSEGGEG